MGNGKLVTSPVASSDARPATFSDQSQSFLAGADRSHFECGIHWWTAATLESELAVERVMGGLGPPEGPGAFGHPAKRYHESGTAVYCGSKQPGQPIVINAPGEVCEAGLSVWSAGRMTSALGARVLILRMTSIPPISRVSGCVPCIELLRTAAATQPCESLRGICT